RLSERSSVPSRSIATRRIGPPEGFVPAREEEAGAGPSGGAAGVFGWVGVSVIGSGGGGSGRMDGLDSEVIGGVRREGPIIPPTGARSTTRRVPIEPPSPAMPYTRA